MKKEKTPEQIYKSRQKTAKILLLLAPVVFWGCLVLSVISFIFAVQHSFGNIVEITNKLDDTNYTGVELEQNYKDLVDKYGEWLVGTGSGGFELKFINIKKAVFSGLMVTNCVFAVLFLLCAFVCGKWLFPLLSKQITQNNQDMVNLEILKDKK